MIRRELLLFLVFGCMAVVLDFCTYRGLLWFVTDNPSLAKGCGFLAGTVFSYLANKYGTFGHVPHTRGAIRRFVLIYTLSLGLNVGVNAAMLLLSSGLSYRITLAFLVATLLSAAFNFVGLKFFVFSARVAA